jgi:hypothetical protein
MGVGVAREVHEQDVHRGWPRRGAARVTLVAVVAVDAQGEARRLSGLLLGGGDGAWARDRVAGGLFVWLTSV